MCSRIIWTCRMANSSAQCRVSGGRSIGSSQRRICLRPCRARSLWQARGISADNSTKLRENPKAFETIQKAHVERLSQFVTTYPKAEDGPDALLQLGMVNEFLGNDTPFEAIRADADIAVPGKTRQRVRGNPSHGKDRRRAAARRSGEELQRVALARRQPDGRG